MQILHYVQNDTILLFTHNMLVTESLDFIGIITDFLHKSTTLQVILQNYFVKIPLPSDRGHFLGKLNRSDRNLIGSNQLEL